MLTFEGGTLLGSRWISGILPKYGGVGGTLLEGRTLLVSVRGNSWYLQYQGKFGEGFNGDL